ncbi:hypothetical protein GUITHDRAFT_150364 [Guillardia theta CCMP2712]|uniref:Uncharacterized protein n=1 Tax=Guillardia theta (strain CCMP2712) TaxID=905079 RepID=L1JYL1_GUITC|nr:hypothetical protein GUITHDRAFT_150364 [Guillardia theta CCMP2712]EKX53280.1 hypothetical protein GUITHDRAFT_150364 [Guillardia theta CCMP2712]|eukprot:XP_005840260.1 hypothetical protein GUITHDRAFT_150364 [Guillardia theta CCMP2712]
MRRAGSTCGLVSSQITSKFQPHVVNPKIERSRFMALQLVDGSQMGGEEEGIVVDMCLEDIDLSEQFVEDLRWDAHSIISSVFNPESDLDYDEHIELSIVLCSDVWIRGLNKKWRQKDTATDVLSFPQETDNDILGDLVISVQTAEAQAAERGHDLRHEMRVLMVHGFLHLLGYDHETGEEDKAEMARAEDKLLSRLGWQSAGLIARVEGE